MNWYTINNTFLSYLRDIEKRIPYTNYGVGKLKPFFGSLFEVGDLVYLTQVSHPKTKHNAMKENIDFLKLFDGQKLIAVVNLNYIFPVHKSKLIHVEYKNIGNFVSFANDYLKGNYITLLKREMKEIHLKDIASQALSLYKFKYEFPNNMVSKRCFDFKLLEEKCLEYIEQEEIQAIADIIDLVAYKKD